MSFIIHLQNLPSNAKSRDIRNFFEGLRIPDDGIHILGGDKGDAFISFMTNEDGCLAMLKDGWKINESRVKLFLSSYMEMQHEVEERTKSSLVDTFSSKTCSKSHSSPDEFIRGRSSEKRWHSDSLSPYSYRDCSVDKSRTVSEYRQRSRSPIEERIYSSKQSPRRKSRSPKRYVISHRSSSSEYISVKQEKRSLSPERDSSFVHEVDSESKSLDQQSVSQSQLQIELERHINNEFKESDGYHKVITEDCKPPMYWNAGGFDVSVKEEFPFNSDQPYQQSNAHDCNPQNSGNDFNSQFSAEELKSEHNVVTPISKSFFVLLSGLDPEWKFDTVQMILKGFFAPQSNIRFDKNRLGLKTGKVVVKIANEDDYKNILKIREVTIDGLKIKLCKCHIGFIKRLFPKNVSKWKKIYQDIPYERAIPYEPNEQSYAHECEPQNIRPCKPLHDQLLITHDNDQQLGNFSPGYLVEAVKSECDLARPSSDSFFVLLSDLNPKWKFKKVRMILKGFFLPYGNIRFEKNHEGSKTGRVVVKVFNKEDYDNILKIGEVIFRNFKIKLNRCDLALIKKLFPVDRHKNFDQYPGFCYRLKGIPPGCRYEDVANFFHGYEIADIVINNKCGRGFKPGFISFKTRQDFEGASSRNGKKFLQGYIEMLPCPLEHMIKAKNNCTSFNKSSFNSSSLNGLSFIPLRTEKILPMTQHHFCALLSGLSPKTTVTEISSFFSKLGLNPDAIHLTLDCKKYCDGRAFVEFSNFLDFDAALKFHGGRLYDNIVCVKQISYDEMVKILENEEVQHHFNSDISALNVSERIPFLSEPPDAVKVPSKLQMEDSFKCASIDNSETERNRFQDKPVPPNFHCRHIEKPLNCNKKLTFDEYFNSYSKRNTYFKLEDIFP